MKKVIGMGFVVPLSTAVSNKIGLDLTNPHFIMSAGKDGVETSKLTSNVSHQQNYLVVRYIPKDNYYVDVKIGAVLEYEGKFSKMHLAKVSTLA